MNDSLKNRIFNIAERATRFVIGKIKDNNVFVVILLSVGIGFIYHKNIIRRVSRAKDKETEGIVTSFFVDTALYNKTLKEKTEYLLNDFTNDIVIGSDEAPVTMIDYSSFSCVYCREMRDDINKIIKEYAEDLQQLRYVIRPIVNEKTIPLKILLNCVENKEKKIALINSMFRINWDKVSSVNTIINNFMNEYNISRSDIFECTNDDREYNKIVYYQRENSLVFDVRRTPLFVINGKKYSGYKTYKELKKIIEENVGEN